MTPLKDGKKTSAFIAIIAGIIVSNMPVILQLLGAYKETLPANSWVYAVVTGVLAFGYAISSTWRGNNARDNEAKIEVAKATGSPLSDTSAINAGGNVTLAAPIAPQKAYENVSAIPQVLPDPTPADIDLGEDFSNELTDLEKAG